MKVVVVEQVRVQDHQYGREREICFIDEINAQYEGMNREQEHFVLGLNNIFWFYTQS